MTFLQVGNETWVSVAAIRIIYRQVISLQGKTRDAVMVRIGEEGGITVEPEYEESVLEMAKILTLKVPQPGSSGKDFTFNPKSTIR